MSEWLLMAGTGEAGHRDARPYLRFVTFGGPTLIIGNTDRPLSPHRAALLGMLATEPADGVSITRATEVLWGSATSKRLRHRISQLVYSLNREFPKRLVVRKSDHYHLNEAVATDYRALLAAISSDRPAEAAVLFKRGFLSELGKFPSRAYSDWVKRTNIALHEEIRRAAAEQWTRRTGGGRWKQAVEPARVLITLSPYDERALRMLVRAEAMSGRVREAEAAFYGFVERAELGEQDWSPQAETLALVRRVRDLNSRAGAKSGARPADGPALVGRAGELAKLSAALLPRRGDGVRVVVLRGGRGTGKTRLVEEALAASLLSDVRVLCGRASEFDGGVFLNSVLSALSSPDLADDIHALAEPWRSTLLALLPELDTGRQSSAGPDAIASHRVHRRHLEAIRHLLAAITRKNPTVLFIDDFHRVDRDSAAVLRYIVERCSSLPLAIMLAAPTERLRATDAVSRFLGSSILPCEPTELSLGRLTRDAAAELVDTIADGRIGAKARERIVKLSGRNPLFILELSKQLLVGQRLPNLDPDDPVPVPQSITRVFTDRLAHLGDDADRALQLLAVCGHPLCVRSLSKLSNQPPDRCVDALDDLQHARLIGWNRHGFHVRHEMIRHAVDNRMNAARRAWAHARVGRHLDAEESTATPAELAVHYHHARMRTQAFQYALAGAGAAEKAGAVAEASKLFALAWRNTDDPRAHARIATRRARLHYARRDTTDGPARLAQAAFQLRRVQRARSALIAELQRVDLLASSGSCPPREALARIRALERTAERAKHWSVVAKALDLELHIHRGEGRIREADKLAVRARRLLGRVEPEVRGSLHATLALHHRGNLDARLGHARKAIAAARRTGARDELLRALARLVAIRGAHGLIADAEATSAVEEGESLAAKSDDFVEWYNLLAAVGTGYRAVGRLDRARIWFSRAGTLLAQVNTGAPHVALECKLGELALEARKLDRAAAHFTRARKHWTPGMGRHLRIISHSGTGVTALRTGELGLAREMAEHIAEPPAGWFEDPWMYAMFKARLCEWRGVVSEGADAIDAIAKGIEKTQPAHWARLKLDEALLRLRHSLPRRDEVAETAAKAAASLGIDRWTKVLRVARERGR